MILRARFARVIPASMRMVSTPVVLHQSIGAAVVHSGPLSECTSIRHNLNRVSNKQIRIIEVRRNYSADMSKLDE